MKKDIENKKENIVLPSFSQNNIFVIFCVFFDFEIIFILEKRKTRRKKLFSLSFHGRTFNTFPSIYLTISWLLPLDTVKTDQQLTCSYRLPYLLILNIATEINLIRLLIKFNPFLPFSRLLKKFKSNNGFFFSNLFVLSCHWFFVVTKQNCFYFYIFALW